MAEFKYDDFKAFKKAVSNLNTRLPAFLERFLKKKALEALMLTKQYTPVDTGNLEENWYLSEIERKGNDLVIYLCNDVEYASYVEYGHDTKNKKSYVPGVYMSTISIQEVQDSIPNQLQAEFIQWCQKLGVA